MKVLGISGSLRNARYGAGSRRLVDELRSIRSQDELQAFLKEQTRIRSDEFIEAGLNDDTPFDLVYKNLQKLKGEKGLSNSEASLAAGLWGALQVGADIQHVGLSRYFPMNGHSRHLEELKQTILDCDAFLVSGPVYFGDRGSLVQAFIEFISSDAELRAHCAGKVYGGIAVGAKRNGGQETLLIYQLIDMCNLNMLAVGNNHETSSQYGGTMVAGDVGTAWSDKEGLTTSVGTGKRVAQIAMALARGQSHSLKGRARVGIWMVQDSNDKRGLNRIKDWIAAHGDPNVDYQILDLTSEEIYRCIACDLCPTHHAPPDEYACIIKSPDDFFVRHHADLINVDAILLAAYSPADRSNVTAVYQKFMERTRYIRRASYSLTDRLVAPLVISEINANQNLHIRILTSLIRHHTIVHHPLIAHEMNGAIINESYFVDQLKKFSNTAIELTKARLLYETKHQETWYNPIGYFISAGRNETDRRNGILDQVFSEKRSSIAREKSERLIEK